ncbi:MAG: CesT family type III secretion system chaperone [Pseudomonadota bacterium]
MDATARDLINHYLAELGRAYDAEIALDREGNCVIEDDAGNECLLSVIDSGCHFLLTSELTRLDSTSEHALLRRALILNGDLDTTGGACVSYVEDRKVFIVHRVNSVRGLSFENFRGLVEDFLDTVADIEERLGEDPTPATAHLPTERAESSKNIRV